MKKDGLTLPELLIIIVIVIALIIAYFPISKHFKKQKSEEEFLTKIKTIYQTAKKDYKAASEKANGEFVYFDSEDNYRKLSENGDGVRYYIGFNSSGEIVYFVVYNDEFKMEAGYINTETEITTSEFGLKKSEAKYKIIDANETQVPNTNLVYDGMEIRLNKYNSVNGYLLGDVNRDKKLTEEDAQLINNYINSSIKFDDEQKEIADVTKDGKVNNYDSLQISRYITGAASVYDSYKSSSGDATIDGTNIALTMYNSYGGYLIGDVNKDGKLTDNDSELIKNYYNGKLKFDDLQMKLADVDENGKINDDDAVQIKRYISGNNSKYDSYGLLPQEEKAVATNDGTNIVRMADITYNKIVLGDVNKDEKITIEDADLIKAYIEKKKEFTEEEIKIADVDKNGTVENNDVLQINRYTVGRSSVYDKYLLDKDATITGSEYKGPECKFTKGESIIDKGITVNIECVNNGYGCTLENGSEEMFVTGSTEITVVDRGGIKDTCKIEVEPYYVCDEKDEKIWVPKGTLISNEDISEVKENTIISCYKNFTKNNYICRQLEKQKNCDYTIYYK